LDFKNGAEFLFRPLFFLIPSTRLIRRNEGL
jgi:hypothetical protein